MTEQKQITKDIVILYHAECNDGFGSAWAAWKKFGNEADYIPVILGKYQDNFSDKEIYTLDLTLPKEITEKLLKTNKRLTSIDHHISAEEVTKMTKEYSFDNNHSGSVLAWKYFHPDKEVPRFLLLIEDADIWKWEYPETSDFIASLALYDYDFDTWDKISLDVESPEKIKDYLYRGKIINTYIKRIANDFIKHAQKVNFEGYEVYTANVYHPIKFLVSHFLKEKYPPFSVTWAQEGDVIHVSLRSDGSVDVSEIAKKYGGGGHKAAAGFSFPAGQPFPWKMIKNE